jgi:hypothetical protein
VTAGRTHQAANQQEKKTMNETGNQSAPTPSVIKPEFRAELEKLINRHSMENGSNTPDFVLATYLADCLEAFDKASTHRESWYGRAASSPPLGIAQYPQDFARPGANIHGIGPGTDGGPNPDYKG